MDNEKSILDDYPELALIAAPMIAFKLFRIVINTLFQKEDCEK